MVEDITRCQAAHRGARRVVAQKQKIASSNGGLYSSLEIGFLYHNVEAEKVSQKKSTSLYLQIRPDVIENGI